MVKKLIALFLSFMLGIILIPINNAFSEEIKWDGMASISLEVHYNKDTNPSMVELDVIISDYKDLSGLSFVLNYDSSKVMLNEKLTGLNNGQSMEKILDGDLRTSSKPGVYNFLYEAADVTTVQNGKGRIIKKVFFDVLDKGELTFFINEYSVTNLNADDGITNNSDKPTATVNLFKIINQKSFEIDDNISRPILNKSDNTIIKINDPNLNVSYNWEPELSENKFNIPNQLYKIKIIIKPNEGYILGEQFSALLKNKGDKGILDKNTNTYVIFTDIGMTDSASLVGIEITEQPIDKEYLINESFNPNGMKVSALFEDGSKFIISEGDYEIINDKFTSISQNSVTIKYKGFTTDVTGILVHLREATAEQFNKEDMILTYNGLNQLNSVMLKIGLISAEEETGTVNYKIRDSLNNEVTEIKQLGEYKVIASIQGGTIYNAKDNIELCKIVVIPQEINNLNLVGVVSKPVKDGIASSNIIGENVTTSVTWNPTLNGENKFEGNTEYSAKIEITPNYGYIIKDYSMIAFEDYILSFSDGKAILSKTYDKTEQLSVTGISIVSEPTNKKYEVGQPFNEEGMIVKATYEDGSEMNINDYTVLDGSSLKKDQTSVTVSYGGFEAKINGIVVDLKPFDPTIIINNIGIHVFDNSNQKSKILSEISSNKSVEETGLITYIFKDSEGNITDEIKNAGDYSLHITTLGGSVYDSQTSELFIADFNVQKKNILPSDFEKIADELYTSNEIKPVVTSLKLNNSDFEIKGYKDNINASNNASIIVEGKGKNYAGTATLLFSIKPIEIKKEDLLYSGKIIEKEYDSTNTLEDLTLSLLPGILKGKDKLTVNANARFADVNVGDNIDVIVTPISIIQGNYILISNSPIVLKGKINPRKSVIMKSDFGTETKPVELYRGIAKLPELNLEGPNSEKPTGITLFRFGGKESIAEINELLGSLPISNDLVTIDYSFEGSGNYVGLKLEGKLYLRIIKKEAKNLQSSISSNNIPKVRKCEDDGYPSGYYWDDEKMSCIASDETKSIRKYNLIVPNTSSNSRKIFWYMMTASSVLLLTYIFVIFSNKNKKIH